LLDGLLGVAGIMKLIVMSYGSFPKILLRFYAAGTSYGMRFPMGWRYGFEFSMAIMNPHDDPVLVEKSWRSFHQFWCFFSLKNHQTSDFFGIFDQDFRDFFGIESIL